MTWKSLLVTVAALLAAGSAPAQDSCPMEATNTVAQSVSYGAAVACPGLNYSVPGLRLSTTSGCPLFATVIPDHEVAVPSKARTMVSPTGVVPGKILFFECQTSYLIFIPISSVCVFLRDVNFGAYQRLTTVACITPQP